MFMKIGFSRCINGDPLGPTLGLGIHQILIVFSHHDCCAQICTRFHARLIKECVCVCHRVVLCCCRAEAGVSRCGWRHVSSPPAGEAEAAEPVLVLWEPADSASGLVLSSPG